MYSSEKIDISFNRRVISGDKDAIGLFYENNFAKLWLFASHYVMDKEIGRDIVHDCFLKFLDNLDKANAKQSLKGYLYIMVKNRCLNHLRSCKIADTNKTQLIEAFILSEDDTEDEEIYANLEKYLKKLPDQQRKVIQLKLEGKSRSEIAEIIGVTVSTVDVHIKRSYSFLRNKMDKLLFFVFF